MILCQKRRLADLQQLPPCWLAKSWKVGGGKGSSWVLGAVTKNSFFHIICRSHFHIICRSILGWINQHEISSSKQTCHSINSWCAKGSWSRSRLLGVIFVVLRGGGGFFSFQKFILKMLVEVDFLLNPKDVTTAKALAQRFKLDKDRHGEMGD